MYIEPNWEKCRKTITRAQKAAKNSKYKRGFTPIDVRNRVTQAYLLTLRIVYLQCNVMFGQFKRDVHKSYMLQKKKIKKIKKINIYWQVV